MDKIVPADQIDRRNGGCGVIFENKLYVWGGNGTDVRYPYRQRERKEDEQSGESDSASDDSEEEEDEDEEDEEAVDPDKEVRIVVTLPRPNDENHPFDVLDLQTHTWSRQATSGPAPTLGLGSSLEIHHPSSTFILFSGFKDVLFDCEVYKVSPCNNWEWVVVRVRSAVKPSERYLTGVIVHADRMIVFGGVGKDIRKIGTPPEKQDPGAVYRGYTEDGVLRDYGWTNEYLEFNINTDEWVAPLEENASRPEPLGSHAFSKFDSHRAVLFGGNGSLIYSNKAYLLDIETRVWTGPFSPAAPDRPWPVASRFPTLTSLVEPERVGLEMYEGCGQIEPKMLLLWGKTSRQHLSTESWILEFDFNNEDQPLIWKQISIGVEPRSWHIARPVHQTTSCRVVVFGGNHYKYPGTGSLERNNAAHLKILHFGISSLVELCLEEIASNSQLMAAVQHWTGRNRQLVQQAHSRYVNCALTKDIHFC